MNTFEKTVHLVDFYWTRDKDPRIPLGHASLRASLEQAGIIVCPHVHAVNATGGDDIEYIVERIIERAHASSPPHDVAIGAYVWAEEHVTQCIAQLREKGFAGRIILGGPQISYSVTPLEDLYPQADAFIRGYGEEALCRLIKDEEPGAITGVHLAGTPDRAQQAQIDLSSIASPWLTGTIPLQGQQFIRWETQRGCSYRCAFCQHREPGKRLKRRQLNRGRIFDEIALFCRSGVQDIAVLDPIFNLPAAHAVEVLEAFIAHGYTGRLSLQCRAEGITREFIEAASQLDTRLEFGLQTIHHAEGAAIQRQNHIPKVEQALALVREHDIPHEVSLIFGLPEQTLESFTQSVQWCLDQRVPTIKAFPLMLLRGTPLDAQRERWDLHVQQGGYPVVRSSSSFTSQERDQMALLSDALKLTEGRHPRHVTELIDSLTCDTHDHTRWQPISLDTSQATLAR